MNERLEEQVSRFVDDEMSAGECELFVRRLERDANARQRFARYHLVGDVLRGEHRYALAAAASSVAAREQPAVAQRSPAKVPLLVGGSLVAGLAAVVLVGLQMAGSGVDRGLSQIASADNDATDMQYLMLHAGHMSGVSRTMTQSNLIITEDASLEPDAEAEVSD